VLPSAAGKKFGGGGMRRVGPTLTQPFPRMGGRKSRGRIEKDKPVRSRRPWVSLIFVAFALTSCASWQTEYLKEAANHATTAEVENRLGRAHSTWDLQTGETLWTYQSGVPSGTDTGGITVVGPGWVIGRRSDCTAYVLLFDQQKVLRAWMRQPCKPDRPLTWNDGSNTFAADFLPSEIGLCLGSLLICDSHSRTHMHRIPLAITVTMSSNT
jgi:hypothetical protein